MVDLVKIRKKAKERESQKAAAAAAEVTPPVVAGHSNVAEDSKVAGHSNARSSNPKTERNDAEAVPPEPEPAGTPAAPALPAAAEADILPEPILPAFPERGDAPSMSAAAKLDRFKEQANERVMSPAALEVAMEDDSLSQLELLTFLVANEQYALDIEHIVEIIPPRRPTRVPNAPATIGGVFSLRGAMVTLVNVRRKLGHGDGEPVGDPRIIVVDTPGGTAGFLVDRVLRVSKVDPSAVSAHPVVTAAEQREYIKGVFQLGESLFILLDLEKLLLEQVI